MNWISDKNELSKWKLYLSLGKNTERKPKQIKKPNKPNPNPYLLVKRAKASFKDTYILPVLIVPEILLK